MRLEGEIKRPGTYTIKQGERLSAVLKRAGGFTDEAYLRGTVLTRERVKSVEKEQLQKFLNVQDAQLLAQAGRTDVVGVDKEQAAQNAETLAARRELLRALASRVSVGRVVIQLVELEQFEGSPSDVVLEDGDKLVIPGKLSSVAILGAVRNPTSVFYEEGAGVQDYLNRAGGLTKQADKKEIYIAKVDGSAITGFTELRIIEPGDTIIVPPKEEVKYRWLSISRDWITIMLPLAALVALL